MPTFFFFYFDFMYLLCLKQHLEIFNIISSVLHNIFKVLVYHFDHFTQTPLKEVCYLSKRFLNGSSPKLKSVVQTLILNYFHNTTD